MSTQIFVNLPVKDLERSKAFYTALGYSLDEQFTDENAACVVISDEIYVMLLVESFFQTFTKKTIVDASTGTETIHSLSVDSREEVDAFVENALASGGSFLRDPEEYGFMYQRSFQDVDGHLWEIIYMESDQVDAPPAV